MSEFKLTPKSGFGLDAPLAESWTGFAMNEIANLSVWWMSVSSGGVSALDKACAKAFGKGLPQPGTWTEGRSGGSQVRILSGGDRQYFVTGLALKIPAAIAKVALLTEQSDGWIAMRIEGEKTRQVMEKLCGIDIDASVFPAGSAARAPIEGMLALIACDDAVAPVFTILFQRSSARSMAAHFRHAANSTCPRH